MLQQKKGKVDIALGNAVGSNIFNILFILGISSTISQISVNPVILIDGLFMVLITIICYIIVVMKKSIDKKEGLFLLTLFLGYLTYIIIRN